MEAGAAAAPKKINLIAIVAISLAVFVVANDFTAVSVSLTDMERDLHSDLNTIQWVINGYALVFGVFIITAGRLADLYGRREMFFVGAAIFAALSLIAALATSPIVLILARMAMGIGGAMIWTAALGMIFAELGEDKAGLAGGIVLGVAGIGNAAGPLIGGGLTEAFGWQAIFLLNLPIALLAVVIVFLTIHQKKPERGEDDKLDWLGTITLTIGLVALLLALDQVDAWGWGDWRIIALLVACPVFLVMFFFIERRVGRSALIPRDVMSNDAFRSVFFAVLLMSGVFFTALVYLPQFFQKVLQYNPLEAGAALLPFMAIFAVTSFVAGRVYDKLGPKLVVSTGAAFLTVGMFAVALPDVEASYASFIPGMICLGLGAGLFYSSVTTAGVTALDPSRTSLAGGVVYLAQVGGGAVFLGIATTIFTSVSLDTVKADVAGGRLSEAAQKMVDDTLVGQGTVTGELRALAAEAFVDGVHTAFYVAGAVAVLGFLLALFKVGGPLGRKEPAPAPAPSDA